jgi:hypothetical protein
VLFCKFDDCFVHDERLQLKHPIPAAATTTATKTYRYR